MAGVIIGAFDTIEFTGDTWRNLISNLPDMTTLHVWEKKITISHDQLTIMKVSAEGYIKIAMMDAAKLESD